MIEINGLKFLEKKDDIGFAAYSNYYPNGTLRFEYKNVTVNSWLHESYFELNDNSEINFYSSTGIPYQKIKVFLIPNKGDSLLIFDTNITELKSPQMVLAMPCSVEYLKDEISYRKHIINFSSNEIKTDDIPVLLLKSASQDVLGYLKNNIPNKNFVLVKRWDENYASEITDEVWKTGQNSHKYGSDDEVLDFIGSDFMDSDNIDDYYDYDELRIFEEDVFKKLKSKNGYLDLDVDKYKIELSFVNNG